MNKKNFNLAFTMAEILLSLTIIGVVAAITLPSLTGNINERTWNTQRKALHARMSQAIALMGSLNGYGQFVEGTEETEGTDNVAITFVRNGLAKVLQLNNICDNEHLKDCGLPEKFKAADGTTYFTSPDGEKPLTSLLQLNPRFHGSWSEGGETYSYTDGNINDFKAAGFETKNGESVMVFYNPFCTDFDTAKYIGTGWNGNFYVRTQRCMCADFMYDLNGKKGPNIVGKDIGFITALYPTDSAVVAPVAYTKSTTSSKYRDDGVNLAANKCKALGDYRLPSNEELMSMFYNRELIYERQQGVTLHYWSNKETKIGEDDYAYIMKYHTGQLILYSVTSFGAVICVER